MIKISNMQGVVSLKISIITELDSTDMQIISILQASKKSWSAYQIHTLLEYRGVEISSSSLRERLKRLATISIISSERGSRVFRYKMQHFVISSAQM